MSRISFLLPLIALGSPAVVAAQDSTTVGPPVLEDFQLPGTRETPPAQPQDVPETQPQPEQEAPAEQPAPRRQPRAQAPTRATPPPSRPEPVATQPAPTVTEEPVAAEPPLPPPADATAPPPAASQTAAEPVAPEEDFPVWWAIAGGAVALLLVAGLLLRRRRRNEAQEPEAEAMPVAVAPPPPPPPPAPVAPPVRAPELEVAFRPERMVATDKDVTVHFALRVKNGGTVEIRDMVIDARLFSAGPDQTREIAEFLKGPIGRSGSAVPFNFEPERGAEFGSAVFIPKGEVREIMLQGRPLFVPTVAIKIDYLFGEGRKARATGTYLVGIEPKDPAQKMGAFRLDLGPRVYRSVGQREIEVA